MDRDSEAQPDPALDRLVRRSRPGATVEERRAFGALWQDVVGRPPRAVTLARYVLLERLGVGGAGVVYAAYDPELDRKVAIKLLRVGVETGTNPDRQRARLLREAQAMARLAHPNVIAVHDVGTYREDDLDVERRARPTDEPGVRGVFLVMELADGIGLGEWLAEAPRQPEEILAVFVAAGRGLAAAHSVEVVHRDFKPSNVLVGRDGRVRVLDFGLARIPGGDDSAPRGLEPTLAPPLHVTQAGTVLGTPAYMAPEQHQGGAIDPRTDQFAFAVALAEALFGVRPFSGATLDELLAHKLAGPTLPPGPPTLPNRVRRALLRALAPTPQQRYVEMDALLRELTFDPHQRARAWVGIGGAVLLGVLAATGIGRLPDARPSPCGDEDPLRGIWDDDAKRRLKHGSTASSTAPWAGSTTAAVEGRLDEYAESWTEARARACRVAFPGDASALGGFGQHLLCLDRKLQHFQQVIELISMGDPEITTHAIELVTDLPPLDDCDESKSNAAPSPVDREVVLSVERHLAQAQAFHRAGKYEQAAQTAQQALGDAQADVLLRVRALGQLGIAELELARYSRAQSSLEAAFELSETHGYDELTLEIMGDLVALAHARAQVPEATRLARHALARVQRVAPGSDLEARIRMRVAEVRTQRAEYGEALEHWDRALALLSRSGGRGHLEAALALRGKATTLVALTDFDAARDALERALGIWQERVGDTHPRIAELLEAMSAVARQRLEIAEAERLATRALAITEATLGTEHPRYAMGIYHLGNVYRSDGRPREALAAYELALERLTGGLGAEHPDTARALANSATVLWELGRPAEAMRRAEQAAARFAKAHGPDHPTTIYVRLFIGTLLLHASRCDEALANAVRADTGLGRVMPAEHIRFAEIAFQLGAAKLCLGDTSGAAKAAERGLASLAAREDGVAPWELELMLLLAEATRSWDPHRARALESTAAWHLERAGGTGQDWFELWSAMPWTRQHQRRLVDPDRTRYTAPA